MKREGRPTTGLAIQPTEKQKLVVALHGLAVALLVEIHVLIHLKFESLLTKK